MKLYRETKSGYRIYKPYYWLAFLSYCLLAFFVIQANDFDLVPNVYIVCEIDGCLNPLTTEGSSYTGVLYDKYDVIQKCRLNYDWCDNYEFKKGVYGTPPPSNMRYYLFIITAFFTAFALNHFIHNRGKKIDYGFSENLRSDLLKLEKFLKKFGFDGFDMEGKNDEDDKHNRKD